jgi:glycine cleavage system H protein
MSIPANLHYTAEHEWLDQISGTATVGITLYAADALGDVVFVKLPDLNSEISAGSVCGELESTKSLSDLYAPVSGKVVAVNDAAVDNPAVINQDPYGAGWLFKVEVSSVGDLLTADQYSAQIA